jgi:ABC-type branched-subunit amino acid transport system ATPase component/ABC-type branched-subunit amino acid transport system permease subunit
MRRNQIAAVLPVAAVALVLYLIPMVIGVSQSLLEQFNEILSITVLGLALNIAAGFAGQFLLGLGAVYAIGGYTAAILAYHQPGVGLIGMSAAAVITGTAGGLVIGLPALRVGGFYLGVVSLFAAIVVPLIAQNASWAGGATGIPLFANPNFVPGLTFYGVYAVWVTVIIAITVFSWALLHSRLGRRFLALASSQELAGSVGSSSYLTKLTAVGISSAIAALGGAMYAYSQEFFAPGSASVNLSVMVLAAVVIGGLGTITGPLVGCALILTLNQFLSFQQYTGYVFGGLLLIFIMFAPRGLVPAVSLQLRQRLAALTGTERAVTGDTASANGQVASPRIFDRGPADQQQGLLQVQGARCRFGGVNAVDGVSLAVERGSLTGLIGSNGSGKTTLLNLISGFNSLDGGSVGIGQDDLSSMPPYRRARTGIGRTFQTPKLMERQTALVNVMIGADMAIRCSAVASIFRLPRGRRAERASQTLALDALHRFGLDEFSGRMAGELPHGTRRLIELARAVATQPGFLLVDEPAAGLSEAELGHLSRSLAELASTEIGVLLIEHNVPMVLELAGRITALHQGTILFEGTPDEMRADPQVASAFLGSAVDKRTLEEAAENEYM